MNLKKSLEKFLVKIMILKIKIYEIGFEKFLIFLKIRKRFEKDKIVKRRKVSTKLKFIVFKI